MVVKTCPKCDGSLFGPVAYCPYCAHRVGAVDTGANAEAVDERGDDGREAREASATPTAAVPIAAAAAAAAVESQPSPPVPEPPKASEPAPKPAARADAPADGAPKRAAPAQQVERGAADGAAPPTTRNPGRLRKILRNAVLGVAAIVAVLAYLGHQAGQKAASCERYLTAGQQLLRSGDFSGAQQQGQQAAQVCEAEQTAKATQLLDSIQQARASGARDCARAIAGARVRLQQARLNEAAASLDGLPDACASSASAIRLRQQLTQARAAEDNAEANLRKAIAVGDPVASRNALNVLERLDRTRSDLTQFREQIAAIQPPAQAAPLQPSTVQPAPSWSSVAPGSGARNVQPVAPPAPSVAPQSAMAQQFIRSAEGELAQSHFDAARTFAESARQVDPNNPRIATLLRTIQSREHQLLQDETTIK
jgi:hypothetical protein